MSIEARDGEDGLIEGVSTILWDLDMEIVCCVHALGLHLFRSSSVTNVHQATIAPPDSGGRYVHRDANRDINITAWSKCTRSTSHPIRVREASSSFSRR